MPGFLTHFTNNEVLDYFFGCHETPVRPVLWVGLATNPANKEGVINELTSPGYSRACMPNTSKFFGRAKNGKKQTVADIVFPAFALNGERIATVFISDSVRDGIVLAMVDMDPPYATAPCVRAKIRAGALTISHS